MTPIKKLQVLAILTALGLGLYFWGPARMRGVTNYWISATGSDAGGTNPCTNSASPCLTFAYAIPKLQPGDQLRVMDGTYTSPNFIHINCSASAGDAPRGNASNGTALAGITIIADHERKAKIQGNGTVNPIYLSSCSYWTVQGFYVTEIDGVNPPGEMPGSPIAVNHGFQNGIYRNLTYGRNRETNSHPIEFDYNANGQSLVAENECYCFGGRYPLMFSSDNNTWRRNYSNNRTADAGCDHIDNTHRNAQGPNEAFKTYISDDSFVENNIFEQGEDVTDDGSRNTYKGNIFLNQTIDGFIAAKSVYQSSAGGTYMDNAVVNAFRGIFVEGKTAPPTAAFRRNTVFNSGEIAFYSSGNPPGINVASSFGLSVVNHLHVTSVSSGLALQDPLAYDQGLSYDHVNSFNNSPNFSASTNGFRTNDSTTDPAFGTCKGLWLPAGSPMIGAGASGENIGATILYATKFGVQQASTSANALWNSDGTWASCGAIVTGINDVAGKSCFDVNQRLNVAFNGCALPAGYNAANAATPTPTLTFTPTPTFTNTPTPSPTFTLTPTPTWTAGGPTATPAGVSARMYQCPGFVVLINEPTNAPADSFKCPTRTPTP